ncbi:MAG: hypothetical protein VYB72_10255, partial [Planctomycetota bacterium]|nr:hypothetical protein [Planctomycetota bacterium]
MSVSRKYRLRGELLCVNASFLRLRFQEPSNENTRRITDCFRGRLLNKRISGRIQDCLFAA